MRASRTRQEDDVHAEEEALLEAALAEWPDPKGSPHVLLLCPFLEVPASVEALPVSFGAKAFAIRQGSGGYGRHRGGERVERRLRHARCA